MVYLIYMKQKQKESGLKLLILVVLFIGIIAFLLTLNNKGSFILTQEKKELSSQSLFLSSTEKVLIDSPDFLLISQNSIQAGSPPTIFSPRVLGVLIGGVEHQENRNTIIQYIVESGDSLWSIANKFNISVDTIIWANDLRETVIRPGQKLIILPVSGIRHIVREGDTLSAIVEKYKGAEIEKIISFNNLPNEETIFTGQSLIIPGGEKAGTISAVLATNVDITTLTPKQVYAKFSTNHYWGQSHSFPFGQCTWWVAQKRAIPSWGNANTWLPNARAAGLRTCKRRDCIPEVGAVIVVKGCSTFGHVAYVEKVRGNKITFSEMNTIDWGRINTRTVEIGNWIIIGYIYPVK